MELLQGIVADDLTGGLETAAMLVACGVDCGFTTHPGRVGELTGSAAVVVAQKTRVIPAPAAVAKSLAAARALLAIGAKQLFFKYCATFDSTDQGNIGPVADALLDLRGATHTAYCPTSAEAGRTVFNGYLFFEGQLLSESPKRLDPLTPMTDANLLRVLGRQTPHPVGLLPHRLVQEGGSTLAACSARLAEQGVRHLIADAIYPADLAALAELTADWPVMTGNAPIIRFFPPLWRERGWLNQAPHRRALPGVEGLAVVLAGSCAARTLEQLAAFERQRPVLRIDLASVTDGDTAVTAALDWAAMHLPSGPVAIATSAEPEAVATAQERLGRSGAASLAEEILGRLAVGLREAGVRRFLVAGGETSGAVVEHLGISRMTVGGYQGPGVARATAQDGNLVALTLKSGKLGEIDMFMTALETMRHPEG